MNFMVKLSYKKNGIVTREEIYIFDTKIYQFLVKVQKGIENLEINNFINKADATLGRLHADIILGLRDLYKLNISLYYNNREILTYDIKDYMYYAPDVESERKESLNFSF